MALTTLSEASLSAFKVIAMTFSRFWSKSPFPSTSCAVGAWVYKWHWHSLSETVTESLDSVWFMASPVELCIMWWIMYGSAYTYVLSQVYDGSVLCSIHIELGMRWIGSTLKWAYWTRNVMNRIYIELVAWWIMCGSAYASVLSQVYDGSALCNRAYWDCTIPGTNWIWYDRVKDLLRRNVTHDW